MRAALPEAMAAPRFTRTLRRLHAALRNAPWKTLGEIAARVGYAARGVVYLSIGSIALMAALNLWPRAEGAIGAMEAWGRWPWGLLLLWLVGAGLYGFAAWRAAQSVLDADRLGTSPKALASRAGQAISGVAYASLAVAVFGLIDAIEDLREADDRAATRAAIETALAMPLGGLAVTGLGLFVLGAGVGGIVRAFIDHFGPDLDCSRDARTWAGALARYGYAARGVALAVAGVMFVRSGLEARAADAGGVEGALNLLAAGPFGELALGLTAVGLLAFGAFALVEGWTRKIRIPSI